MRPNKLFQHWDVPSGREQLEGRYAEAVQTDPVFPDTFQKLCIVRMVGQLLQKLVL